MRANDFNLTAMNTCGGSGGGELNPYCPYDISRKLPSFFPKSFTSLYKMQGLKAGFEYVTERNGIKLYRRSKIFAKYMDKG